MKISILRIFNVYQQDINIKKKNYVGHEVCIKKKLNGWLSWF